MKEDPTYCYHCGDNCEVSPIKFEDKLFCCNGCKSVYEILSNNTLNKYYTLAEKPGVKPKNSTSGKYKFLDNDEIAAKLFLFNEGDIRKVKLFLPEIHCTSCIWLLENLHLLNEGVVNSEVNFIKKEATITFNISKVSFKDLATLLDKIGYAPKFDGGNSSDKSVISKRFYMQLGVAVFCFGNIMLFSLPEYTNIDESYGQFRTFFSYLILGVSIPLLLFSAKDYWLSAFKALRAKTINLDVPITIGIAALYARSVYDILTNNGPGYMDSFAGFILFLLIGKWFQNKTYQALSFERDYKSYFPLSVTKLVGGKEHVLPLEKVAIEDVILIKNEEIIPADAILLNGRANIDYSFVTGESKTVSKEVGDEIFAGGKQVGSTIELCVVKKVEQSYLTQLWNQKVFEKEKKEGLAELTDKLSRYFIIAVIVIALITAAIWFFIDANNIVNILTSVLIIACPCALALSIPFTFGSAMRAAGRNKLYLKNTDAVEQLGKITDIVFDKTGTITVNTTSNVRFYGEKLSSDQFLDICSVVRNSSHPLSKTIYSHLQQQNNQFKKVKSFQEIPGAGIIGNVNENILKIGSAEWTNSPKESTLQTRVYVSINDKPVGYFGLQNEYRKEFLEIITELSQNYNLHVLSGDNESEKENLKKFFPNEQQIHFNQKPIDKLNYIKDLRNNGRKVLMLGDGLNDAGALKQSNLGIVVSDEVYNFSPACDGIMDASGLTNFPGFLKLGIAAIRTLKFSYQFSLFYNLIGLSFAVTGFLTPLVAAVLMPLSSISVVVLTSLSIRYAESKLFPK